MAIWCKKAGEVGWGGGGGFSIGLVNLTTHTEKSLVPLHHHIIFSAIYYLPGTYLFLNGRQH
jgi:hypothetical protein